MASIRKRIWKTDGETRSAWAVDWSDASGARHRRQFPTRRDADAFRTEIEDQLRKGLFRSEAQKLTIAELAARYIEYLKGRNRRGEGMTQGTLHNYEGKIRNYILSEEPKATLCRYSSKLTLFEGGIGRVKLAHLTAGSIASGGNLTLDACEMGCRER